MGGHSHPPLSAFLRSVLLTPPEVARSADMVTDRAVSAHGTDVTGGLWARSVL